VLGGTGLGLFGAAVTGTAAGAAEPSGGSILRAATFNIHHGAGTDDVLDLERIARVITSLRVQLVGLQEVDRHWSERSDFVDQAGWLARRLRMRHVYGANLDEDPLEPGQPRRQYGTAILSRRPILSWRNTYLPKYDGSEQRGLLEAVIGSKSGKLRFACTHLQHDDAPERQEQAAAIVDLLAERRIRTILVGDLNAVPEAPEIKTLTAEYDDAWVQAGEGDGFTYASDDPHARIDYVLGSGTFHAVAAEVWTGEPTASDHLPMVTTYRY
jgi:endonuclease/exonuclease/phosphatase family metal-dependent hydrolase